jgi:hypothetical protein
VQKSTDETDKESASQRSSPEAEDEVYTYMNIMYKYI